MSECWLPLSKYVMVRASPACTHTRPSPETSAVCSALGVMLPRKTPEVALGEELVELVTSEKPTHSPSVSDVLATFTRRLLAPYESTTSNEEAIATLLPASTSFSKETAPDAGFRSSTRFTRPLTFADGSGSNTRGVLAGLPALKGPLRECTEVCGAPVARFHHSVWDTAAGTDVHFAVPLPSVPREESLT